MNPCGYCSRYWHNHGHSVAGGFATGEVKAQTAEYNGQIARGEDVISRIIYSSRPGGLEELQSRVVETINSLVELACKRVNASQQEIFKACIAVTEP